LGRKKEARWSDRDKFWGKVGKSPQRDLKIKKKGDGMERWRGPFYVPRVGLGAGIFFFGGE